MNDYAAPTVQDILRIARSWMHTPFRHQGRIRGIHGGIDCIGLVIETCREAGLLAVAGLPPTWDQQGYSRFPDQYRLVERLLEYCPSVPVAQMQVGNLVVFALAGGLPAHMGFVADGSQPFSLIHAYGARTPRQARVLEHRLGPGWLRHLHSVYRLPLEEG